MEPTKIDPLLPQSTPSVNSKIELKNINKKNCNPIVNLKLTLRQLCALYMVTWFSSVAHNIIPTVLYTLFETDL